VLANTETLHDKISQLSTRARELEDALATAQFMFTKEPHPLLREDLRSIKNPLERERDPDIGPASKDEDTDEVLDAIDSLYVYFSFVFLSYGNVIFKYSCITKRGRSAFFGHTANSLVNIFFTRRYLFFLMLKHPKSLSFK
jgi:hypothetical protein